MTAGGPLRILLSEWAALRLRGPIAASLAGRPLELVIAQHALPGTELDLAFMTRDVTGKSTKHELEPATQHFHDLLRRAPGLRWVQTHSAGADRPVFLELLERGVAVTTASGANAAVVAQTAVAGVLALARGFPRLLAAQRERRWMPPDAGAPRDLDGQTAVIVGWGPVGQKIAAMLAAAGLRCVAARRNALPAAEGTETVGYDGLASVLPRADWLLLACPLTPRTRGLVDAAMLALLPAGAHLVNVARGEVAVEADLVAALRSGRLAGAYLDVFEHEPLGQESPLWTLENVIVTPHCAGHSDGNEPRVDAMFLANLARWMRDEPLANRTA
ncbi:D-2-hydroxyacid dehydrogenase [Caenimonas terrae]|uniref:D-2-hydroxyacid dehydrogenase n=1 Tax=Caenimonas terrae TaxID=696074 RepID=A0ABW0N7F7_9BURK